MTINCTKLPKRQHQHLIHLRPTTKTPQKLLPTCVFIINALRSTTKTPQNVSHSPINPALVYLSPPNLVSSPVSSRRRKLPHHHHNPIYMSPSPLLPPAAVVDSLVKRRCRKPPNPMAVPGLYRQVLPSPPAIDFSSCQGKKLFSEALSGGTMEGFFKLVSCFQTQAEPAYCGLATLSVVLNALAIDPGRIWKGPWRWFDESMLDCCEPLEKVKAQGITFEKVASLAHCAGAKVEAFRSNQSTIEDFRNHVIRCASSEDCHLVASYHRKHFKQTGTGHFTPIGGYHAASDMALILDVARFKYPPHWVPLTLLWEAMDTIDEATRLHRGFMLISRLQKVDEVDSDLVLPSLT